MELIPLLLQQMRQKYKSKGQCILGVSVVYKPHNNSIKFPFIKRITDNRSHFPGVNKEMTICFIMNFLC